MSGAVILRAVIDSDLPVFCEQQADPEAARMAAFPAREAAFMAHWARIRRDESNVLMTIVVDGQVAA